MKILKFFSWFIILTKYSELLVFPVSFSAEYSYNCIKFIDSFSDYRIGLAVMWCISGFVVLARLFYHFYKHGIDEGLEFVITSLSWLVFPFLPSSHLLVKVGTLVAERLLYIPSIGFCLLVSKMFTASLYRIERYRFGGKAIFLFYLLIYSHVFYLAFLSRKQVDVWKNSETLFQNAVQTCPDSSKMNVQLSQVYFSESYLQRNFSKYFPLGKKHLLHAKRVDEHFCDLNLKFGELMVLEGAINNATEFFLQGLTCIYISHMAMPNLEKIFQHRQQVEKATGKTDPAFHYYFGKYNEIFMDNGASGDSKQNTISERALSEYLLSVYSFLAQDILGPVEYEFLADNLERLEREEFRSLYSLFDCEFQYIKGRVFERTERSSMAKTTFWHLIKNDFCLSVRPAAVSRIIKLAWNQLQQDNASPEFLLNYYSALRLIHDIIIPEDSLRQNQQVISEYLQELHLYEKISVLVGVL